MSTNLALLSRLHWETSSKILKCEMSFNWPHSLNHSPRAAFVLHHHLHQPFHDTLLWSGVICLTTPYNQILNINTCRRISVQPCFPPLHCRILFSSISDVYEVQRGCHHRRSAGNISPRPAQQMDVLILEGLISLTRAWAYRRLEENWQSYPSFIFCTVWRVHFIQLLLLRLRTENQEVESISASNSLLQ